MIKVFVPSWRRPDTTTTPALLEAAGVPYKLVIREMEYSAYRKNFPDKKLIVVSNDHTLNRKREAVRSTLKKGEWCLQMDDNVRGFIQTNKAFYKRNSQIVLDPGETMITRAKWQKIMNEKVDFNSFYSLAVEDTIEEAEKRVAYLCGFSAHDNPAFRGKKFTDVGYVCGKTMLMCNQGLSWCQSTEASGEDYALTAAHLYHNGRVLINKWAHPTRIHYQQGGCGPYAERLPAMVRAQGELSARYGELFAIKNANNPAKKQGELRLRFTSLKQVEQWRSTFTKSPNWS